MQTDALFWAGNAKFDSRIGERRREQACAVLWSVCVR